MISQQDIIRVEEMLNHFPIQRANGMKESIAVAKI